MYRLIFGIFRLLPWWGYAAFGLVLALSAIGLWDSHQARLADAERALRSGPPEVQKVGEYSGYLPDVPFQEVQLAGFIRSDLGLGRLEGTVPKTYFVLDSPDQRGPVVAVMFVGSENQGGLTDLIATADQNGLVVAPGFRRTLDWAAVAGQLRLKGVTREVLLVEAMVGNRATVLREKGNSDLPFVIGVAGVAGISLLVAFTKFRAWRTRRRLRALQSGIQRPAAARKPAPVANRTKAQPTGASPWAKFKPVDKTAPKPPPPTPATARAQTPPVPTRKARPEAPAPEAETAPPFESVFPGGGSGFRFKTADEIIRETFGRVSGFAGSTPTDGT